MSLFCGHCCIARSPSSAFSGRSAAADVVLQDLAPACTVYALAGQAPQMCASAPTVSPALIISCRALTSSPDWTNAASVDVARLADTAFRAAPACGVGQRADRVPRTQQASLRGHAIRTRANLKVGAGRSADSPSQSDRGGGGVRIIWLMSRGSNTRSPGYKARR